MELKEFLEKFLPDYEGKLEEIKQRHKEEEEFTAADCNSIAIIISLEFFPEALQNFTDKICEKQRKYCAHTTYDCREAEKQDLKEFYCIVAMEAQQSCEDAEQPEIDEL